MFTYLSGSASISATSEHGSVGGFGDLTLSLEPRMHEIYSPYLCPVFNRSQRKGSLKTDKGLTLESSISLISLLF